MNFPKNPAGATSISGSGNLVAVPAASVFGRNMSVSAANARAVQITPANSQALYLMIVSFPLTSISKNLVRYIDTTVGDIITLRVIYYVYVSADVTMSFDAETVPDPGDGYTVTVPAYSLALKKGWQLCEMKKVFNNSQQTQTITSQIVVDSDIPWVLTTETFGN